MASSVFLSHFCCYTPMSSSVHLFNSNDAPIKSSVHVCRCLRSWIWRAGATAPVPPPNLAWYGAGVRTTDMLIMQATLTMIAMSLEMMKVHNK